MCPASFRIFKHNLVVSFGKFPGSTVSNRETHFSSVSFKMDTGVDVEIPTSNNERTRLISKRSSRRVLCATLISVWGTLSFGYCVGYSSPASYDLESAANQAIRLSSSQQSWFSVSVSKSKFKTVVVTTIITVYEIIRNILLRR